MVALLRPQNKFVFPGTLPGINNAHPASYKLRLSAIPIGANFVNIAAPMAKGTPANITAAVIESSLGNGLSFTANATLSSSSLVTFPGSVSSTTATAAAIVRMPVSGTFHQTMVSVNSSGLLHVRQTTNQLAWYDGVTAIVLSGITIGNGPYFVAASQSSAAVFFAATNLKTGQISTATVTNANGTISDTTFHIGNDGFNDACTGTIAAGMFSLGTLSERQLAQWAADPWSFWYPQNIGFDDTLVTAAAAAAAGLRLNSSLNGLGSSGPFFHDRIAS